MFDTIILLSSALEREIFMTVLSTHNPSLTIIPIETLADLNALEPDTLAGARLLAFVTGVIVPAAVLDQLGFGAYNFHPGPPAYPALRRRISHFTSAPTNSAPPRMSWPPGRRRSDRRRGDIFDPARALPVALLEGNGLCTTLLSVLVAVSQACDLRPTAGAVTPELEREKDHTPRLRGDLRHLSGYSGGRTGSPHRRRVRHLTRVERLRLRENPRASGRSIRRRPEFRRVGPG